MKILKTFMSGIICLTLCFSGIAYSVTNDDMVEPFTAKSAAFIIITNWAAREGDEGTAIGTTTYEGMSNQLLERGLDIFSYMDSDSVLVQEDMINIMTAMLGFDQEVAYEDKKTYLIDLGIIPEDVAAMDRDTELSMEYAQLLANREFYRLVAEAYEEVVVDELTRTASAPNTSVGEAASQI